MNQKLKIIIIISILIILAVFSIFLISTNSSKENAQNNLRQDNPNFHTVEEGGVCTDGAGDCIDGLTCVNSICQKP